MKTCHSNMLAVLAAALLALPNANAADLTVEVTGIAQSDGQVVVSLFNQSEGWLRKGMSSNGAAAKAGTKTAREACPGASAPASDPTWRSTPTAVTPCRTLSARRIHSP